MLPKNTILLYYAGDIVYKGGLLITISEDQLRKVNAIRSIAGKPEVSMDGLQQLLDWTDEPKGNNVARAGIRRFTDVLGLTVEDNIGGSMVYVMCADQATSLKVAIACNGEPLHWDNAGGPLGPRESTGHSVLLPRDVVVLASDASGAMRDAWRSVRPPLPPR